MREIIRRLSRSSATAKLNKPHVSSSNHRPIAGNAGIILQMRAQKEIPFQSCNSRERMKRTSHGFNCFPVCDIYLSRLFTRPSTLHADWTCLPRQDQFTTFALIYWTGSRVDRLNLVTFDTPARRALSSGSPRRTTGASVDTNFITLNRTQHNGTSSSRKQWPGQIME